MPNHVYATISVEKKYTEKLRELSKVGLCRHYHPMPEELDFHKYYNKLNNNEYGDDWSKFYTEQKEWIEKQKEANKEKYGHEDWYSWCVNNWGTKWGCYEISLGEHNENETYLNFTTAWSPIADHILHKFAEDIPDFEYFWEEEQGYGERAEFVDGVPVSYREWDIPEWSCERWENDPRSEMHETYGYFTISTLQKDYTDGGGKLRKKGFYLDYSLEQYEGTNYEKVVAKLKKITAESEKKRKENLHKIKK